jgi:predicted acyltransferase
MDSRSSNRRLSTNRFPAEGASVMTTLVRSLPQSSPATAAVEAVPSHARLRSVDALRGFDMFWIIGATPLVQALERMSDDPVTRLLVTQLKHVQWEGLRAYDLIFPLFLFLVGVSIVLSVDKSLAQGGIRQVLFRILRRSVLLYLLGIFYYGGLSHPWPDIQLAGVLQRIALCYFAAALLYVTLPERALGVVGIVLLVGYWGLLTFVPFPDLHLDKARVEQLSAAIGSQSPAAIAAAVPERVHGVYAEGYNLTNYVDFRFLPGKKTELYYINEGLLSTLPSIVLCLGGIGAGRLLQDRRVSPRGKVMWLLVAGTAGVLLGYLWGLQFPLIKRIWTSSFVLVATGYSAIFLGVFYLIIDVWQWQRWCTPLVWIGTNALTIYLAVNIVRFPQLAERLVGGDVKLFLNGYVAQGLGDLTVALTGLALALLLVWFLYRRRIFLRV